MTNPAAAPLSSAPRVAPLEVARLLALHSLCFVLPLAALSFFLTAPHGPGAALAWLLVVVASVFADGRSGDEQRQPAPTLPGWPFDSVLYALFALEVTTLALLVRMAATQDFFRMDSLVAWLLMGITSGYSGIVVAHELMHRRSPAMKAL